MVSTQRPSQAERVALNAWLWAYGGCIFADAPNAVTSAVAIAHRISMHRSITPLRVTRSSQASSRTRDGSTTIVPRNSSTARSFTLRTRIRPINRCRDRPERCLQTGKRSFTNKSRLFGAAASPAVRSRRQEIPAVLLNIQINEGAAADQSKSSSCWTPGNRLPAHSSRRVRAICVRWECPWASRLLRQICH